MTAPNTRDMTNPSAADAPARPEDPRRFRTFLLIWVGQVVSTLGSSLSSFGLGVWVFETTQSVTLFSWILILGTLPGILLAAPAGALVDRWDRRATMIWSDLGAGLATLGVVLLYAFGTLQLWHIAVFVTLNMTLAAFQQPAFAASISLLVPKKHLGRASGMTQAGDASARILAPVLAGVLLTAYGLGGIFALDMVTFFFAVGVLFVVRIPRPPRSSPETRGSEPSVWAEAAVGWRFIRTRPGLLALLLLSMATNLSLGVVILLLTPMILTFASPAVLGTVVSTGGLGALAGALTVATWGGVTRRVRAILVLSVVQGVLLVFVGGIQNAVLLAGIAFAFLFMNPVINAADQVIWQVKTPLDLHGRVFAIRRLLAQVSLPVAYLFAGPLADRVFEPGMADGGSLGATFGALLGTGPGRGMGLMFIGVGLAMVFTALMAALHRPLRRVEDDLPDILPET